MFHSNDFNAVTDPCHGKDITNYPTGFYNSANGLPPSLMKKLFKVNSTVLYSLKKKFSSTVKIPK